MATRIPSSPTEARTAPFRLFSDFHDDQLIDAISQIGEKNITSPTKRSEHYAAQLAKSPTYTLAIPRLRKLPQPSFPTSPTSSPRKAFSSPPRTPSKRDRDTYESQQPTAAQVQASDVLFQSMTPKPDFSGFGMGSSSPHKAPPAAPTKKSRSTIVSRFKEQYTALENNEFKMKGQRVQVSYLAEGSYSSVYTLERNATPIIPGVQNSDLVLKAFHGKNAKFHDATMATSLTNAIANYNAIVALGLPVAQIYNADTAVRDGYIIQQKVSGKIDPLNPEHVKQVRPFFDASVRQEIVMDLLPQNFAVTNGIVVLIDFVEEPEDGIEIFNKKACELWLKHYVNQGIQQAFIIVNELTANHYQEFIKELLSPKTPSSQD